MPQVLKSCLVLLLTTIIPQMYKNPNLCMSDQSQWEDVRNWCLPSANFRLNVVTKVVFIWLNLKPSTKNATGSEVPHCLVLLLATIIPLNVQKSQFTYVKPITMGGCPIIGVCPAQIVFLVNCCNKSCFHLVTLKFIIGTYMNI